MSGKISDYFDLGKGTEGDWFAYFKSHVDQSTGEIVYEAPEPDALEFCCRLMGPFFDEKNKGRKKESKMVLNPNTRAMERVSYYPDLPPEEEARQAEDAWDYAIVAVRKSGVIIECTKEDKLELIKRPMFMRYMKRVFQILSGEAVKQFEAAEKN